MEIINQGNTHKNSFAKYLLREKDIRLFQGKNEILICQKRESYPKYWKNYDELKTYINIGSFKEDSIPDMTFSELRQYMIYIRKISAKNQRLRERQTRTEFILTKDFGTGVIEKIPEEHSVQHDIMNERIRLIGPNSSQEWFNLKPVRKEEISSYATFLMEKKTINKPSSYNSSYAEYLAKPRDNLIYITELPLMISKNKLICIAEEKDEPKIGYFGTTGSGKTIGMMSIAGHAFYKWGRRIIILNDSDMQTLSHTLPCNYDTIRDRARPPEENGMFAHLIKIGEEPRPLPIVPLFPNVKELKEENLPFPTQELNVKMSLPIKELINNMEMFLKGEKNVSLGATGKYIEPHKEELLKCRTDKEFMETVNNIFGETQRDVQSMRRKALSTLGNLMGEKIFDINSVPSELRIVYGKSGFERKYLTIQALAIAGLIPSLQTGSIINKPWRHFYFRYILKKIFDDQIEDKVLRESQTIFWLVIDELESLISQVTSEEIIKLFMQGRYRRLGIIYATQNFMKVPKEIRGQTTYAITFRTQQKETLSEIKGTYDLDDQTIKLIQHLKPDQFEAMAISMRKKFVCYNLIDGERTEEEGPFVGKIIPPLSLPQKPRE